MPTYDIISSAEAQQLVQRIARGYGWISQRARDASDQEALEAIDMLQDSLGIAVRTLATNLYKSHARFVFELIQNAEDNNYRKATSSGTAPYIKFTVYPNKIVIDSNEDGFTTENVIAICKVGQSTKKRDGAQQYIGEKGIGFKSVFMVASKVHIQSGPFSFFFEHPPGARGMGMVTPVWEPAEVALPGPLTRMTLTLLDKLDYPELLSQFDTLPDTFLLFLNKLGAITIDKIEFAGKSAESTTFSCALDESSGQATLSKVHHEQRNCNTTEVVLAFPLDESEPIIGPQEVYAYLPLGDFGFSFLIQSDFVTQANRQDVLETRRNKDILDGIAEAFLEGVFQFCNHPTLQYKWPLYIPRKIHNPFWARLENKIHKLLKEHAVLRGCSHGPLRPISQLKKIGDGFKDEFGNALVADLDEEMYLAWEYEGQDIEALDSLGLDTIDFESVMARFRHDLKQPSPRSRFKSPGTTDDWHTRTAELLLQPFKEKWKSPTLDKVRGLACIPLQDGKWTAITEGAVFFSRTNGILIPIDLGLRIVDEGSIANPTRKKLFVTLGVRPASVQDVRALILARYKQERSSISFETSLKDLHFLYSTHPTGLTVKLRESTSLWVFNHRGHPIHDEEDLYFKSDEEHSFQELMGKALEVAPYNSGLVGSFIHPEYCRRMELLPVKPGGSHPAFKAWLQESVGILNHPRLVDPKDPAELSPIFRYIIEARPEKLLGTLKPHWTSYAAVMSTDLASKISKALVPSTNIGSIPLKETFLPSETLTVRCGEFLDLQKFPFLKLENEPDIEGWNFLSAFHVGIEDNLDFYLKILYYCKLSKGPFRYDIYEAIQLKAGGSKEAKRRVEYELSFLYPPPSPCICNSSGKLTRPYFREFVWVNYLILAPSYGTRPPSWTYPGNCFWDAPDYLTTRCALLPALSHFKTPFIAYFFQFTLGVRNVSWDDLTRELRAIKAKTKPDINVVQDIYLRLQRMSADLESKYLESLLTSFEKDALIYDMLSQNWTAPSACLWSKDAQVPGKSTISGQYEDLKDLFVGVLKIKIPNLRLLIKELKRVAQSSPSINDIKSLIWQINTFDPIIKDLEDVRWSEIFPVRKANGNLELQTWMAGFSIIDRQPWADAFEDKVDFLDFSLKEVRILEPFLSSMEGMGYLSKHVKEKSSFQGILPEPSTKRTRQLRRRAYALSRCATHFGSPRAKNDCQALYQLLLKAKVYETDGIIGSLEHTRLGDTVIVEVSNTKLHVEEGLEGLNIYVPKDSKDQEICYLRLLPTKLFNETMMAEVDSNSTLAFDSNAVSIITAIFASSDEVIDLVLEEAGIVPVPYPDQYEDELQQSPRDKVLLSLGIYRNAERETASVGSGTQSGMAMATPGASTPSARSPSLSITAASTYRAIHRPSVPSQPIQLRNSPLRPRPVRVLPDSIRRQITSESSQVEGAFPSKGAFNLDELLNALPVEAAREVNPYDLPFGVRNENQLAHDMKIGAAGELYAFEILSRLETSLPGFGRHNWQSTIRRHVTVHENYRDLEPWRGAETADITYDDTKGEFTQLLIANGHLDGSIWAHATPKYFLEVKTTTKECATRFFLSKGQYQRMQRLKLGLRASAEVYIILRVFNLDGNKIDMRLYVDPAGMEERGELQFTSESYSVLPPSRDGH
ncbi:Uncharacterized protein BP5553_10075 [Venustampulla echinocandica]|uniref:Protein NO VEIN C-terminal domain-containing protein n=1 Tax=Venustampulla echinocandica TaxID=2656787 RepID=A0A370TAC2_9HELO|nr:Uncharacterized protein BP5553_10075 [Venustampulla echinocandica]RDL30730.1 Uncharacterized protein BP5553_10075 [Venustampulla echinocandica]